MDMQKWQALAKKHPCTPIANDAGEVTKVRTCIVRLAFMKIKKPKDGDGEKFTCALIFPPNADVSLLYTLADMAANEKWGGKAKAMKLASPFKQQAAAVNAKTGKQYDGMTDGIYLNASTWFKLPYLSAVGEEIEITPDTLWSGMYVRATLSAAGYDTDGNRGITFRLASLQHIANGEKFASEGGDPADHYDAIVLDDLDDGTPLAPAPKPPASEPVKTPAVSRWM